MHNLQYEAVRSSSNAIFICSFSGGLSVLFTKFTNASNKEVTNIAGIFSQKFPENIHEKFNFS